MKSKQSALLSRLDALDEECGSLRDELAEVESGRRELVGELQQVQARYEQMQTCYDQLQKQLSNEQVGQGYVVSFPAPAFFKSRLSKKAGSGNETRTGVALRF